MGAYDDFSVQVTETDFVWERVPVLSETGKTADSLPWLFYKDGVRELRFQKGFEEEDLVGFLDIIERARRQNPDEDDLLVMLWERDLLHSRYKYVELSDDGGLGLGELTPRNEPQTIEPPRAHDPVRPEEQLLESRPGLVNLADFDATLYFLDEGEVAICVRRSNPNTPVTRGRTSSAFCSTSSRYRRIPSFVTRFPLFSICSWCISSVRTSFAPLPTC